MSSTGYWPALFGGAFIGLSVALLMLLNGRVAGVSGVVSGLWRAATPRFENLAFVAGLVAGPPLYSAVFGRFPVEPNRQGFGKSFYGTGTVCTVAVGVPTNYGHMPLRFGAQP